MPSILPAADDCKKTTVLRVQEVTRLNNNGIIVGTFDSPTLSKMNLRSKFKNTGEEGFVIATC